MFATGTVVSYEVSIGNFSPFPSVFVCRSVYASFVCFVSVVCVSGACPNVEWSKALPLTARCLSPLLWFESRAEHVRKLLLTWNLAVFCFAVSASLTTGYSRHEKTKAIKAIIPNSCVCLYNQFLFCFLCCRQSSILLIIT